MLHARAREVLAVRDNIVHTRQTLQNAGETVFLGAIEALYSAMKAAIDLAEPAAQ